MGALGGDVSAMDINPAGGAIFIKNHVTLTAMVGSQKADTNFEGGTLTDSESNFSIGNFGGVISFNLNDEKWKNFNLGVNYQHRNLDSNVYFAENTGIIFPEVTATGKNPDGSQIVDDEFYYFAGYDRLTTGSKSKFAVNLSSNYDDKIYLGMNINFHNSNVTKTERLIEREDVLDNNFYASNALNTPNTERSQGFSMGFGIIGKVNQILRLGLAYQTPVWNNYIEESFNYSDDINPNGFSSDLSDPNYYYNYETDNSILVQDYDQKRVTTPGRLTASSALVIGKNLALNADYTMVFNKDLRINDSGFIV